MQSAIERCYRAVPPTLENMRPRRHGDTLALKCFLHDCSQCRTFDADGRLQFEESLGVKKVLPWCCDDTERRRIAIDVGVGDLPAYIILSADGSTRVTRP